MGNEKSIPLELKSKDDIKVTNAWIQKSAILSKDQSKICIFEQYLKNENIKALEKFSTNLKLYRHPFILKYIYSWKDSKTFNVATEFGKPLSMVFNNLMPMHICIGLRHIYKAIIFLHDKALSSHNNITMDSIYVTDDGFWKLGSLELMTNSSNYSLETDSDQKGYASLASELLQNISNDDIIAADEFKQYCKSPNSNFFSEINSHPFFNHEFLRIYEFLQNLPAKNETEKTVFFETVVDKLALFTEDVTACILGPLLLTRLVLLNTTAQEHVLPKLLVPKTNDNFTLFSLDILKKYISVKLLAVFCVRDVQTRLTLLKFFKSFCVIFTKEQIVNKILPELLVGIKDTNETLVCATLHSLADLVPLLGASIVIGKERTKFFSDGRPLLRTSCLNEQIFMQSTVSVGSQESIISNSFNLNERLSPEGGEDESESVPALGNDVTTINDEQPFNEDNVPGTENEKENEIQKSEIVIVTEQCNLSKIEQKKREIIYPNSISINDDFNTLDIKCSRPRNVSQFDDIDLMFKSMEPVISKTAIVKIPEESSIPINNTVNDESKFKAVESNFESSGEGWADEITDWEGAG